MNKQVIITGASKGIGLATAKLFLDKGFNVINLSRSPCCLQEVVNIQVDLANLTFRDDLPQTLYAQLPQAPQITLIHNAAKLVNDSVATTQIETLREMLEVNVVAPTVLNQILLPKKFSGPGNALLAAAQRHDQLKRRHLPLDVIGFAAQDAVFFAPFALCRFMRSPPHRPICRWPD